MAQINMHPQIERQNKAWILVKMAQIDLLRTSNLPKNQEYVRGFGIRKFLKMGIQGAAGIPQIYYINIYLFIWKNFKI